MRVAMGLSYYGNAYHGWQRQPGLRTLQADLEAALSQVGNQAVEVVCAGRTDTAVHALSQVVHFDAQHSRSTRSWVMGSNSLMPNDISVLWAEFVPSDFHARHSALARTYRYVIYNHAIRPALWMHHVTWFSRPLDAGLMHEAAQVLVGSHDFSSFRGADCQSKSTQREIFFISVKRQGPFIFIHVKANAFLQHMVRNIVGVLMAIGSGQRASIWCEQVLKACDRGAAGMMAPPYGLYLWSVDYPEVFNLPSARNSLEGMLLTTDYFSIFDASSGAVQEALK